MNISERPQQASPSISAQAPPKTRVPRTLVPELPRDVKKRRTTRSSPMPGTSQTPSVEPTTERRNQYQRDTGDDHDDGAMKAPNSTYKGIKSCEDDIAWACPFFKRDPWRYHKCLNSKLGKISYVKQHLYRCHSMPSEYCQTCFKGFQHREEVEEHQSHGSCLPRKCPFMTNAQRGLVQGTKARQMDEREKWHHIWDILFPDEFKPESPFTDHVFIEAMHSYRKFCQGPGREIVPNLLRELEVPESTISSVGDTLAERILTQIQEESRAVLFEGTNSDEGSETSSTQRNSVSASSLPTQERDYYNPDSSSNVLQSSLFIHPFATDRNANLTIDSLNRSSYINESPLSSNFGDPINSPALPLFGVFDNSNEDYDIFTGSFLGDTYLDSHLRPKELDDNFLDVPD